MDRAIRELADPWRRQTSNKGNLQCEGVLSVLMEGRQNERVAGGGWVGGSSTQNGAGDVGKEPTTISAF